MIKSREFLIKTTKNFFDKNLNLTDTDSCSMFFILISKLECCIPDSDFRNVLFEIFKHSKIGPRLEVSDDFWQQLRCRIKEREKLWDFMKLKTLIMQISVQLQ